MPQPIAAPRQYIETASRLWSVWSKAGGPVPGLIGIDYETAHRSVSARKAAGTAVGNERPVRCRAELLIDADGIVIRAALIYPKR